MQIVIHIVEHDTNHITNCFHSALPGLYIISENNEIEK